MKDFRTLQVWKKSHLLTIDIYLITQELPKSEIYGLTSQIRRAVSSVPTNIAEGCGRGSDLDFARFIQIAMGSASESLYLLILLSDLKYIDEEKSQNLIERVNEIMKMLSSLLKILKNKV